MKEKVIFLDTEKNYGSIIPTLNHYSFKTHSFRINHSALTINNSALTINN